MNYPHFKEEDFITDEYFIQWAKHPTGESQAFWEKFILEYPYQEKVVRKAREVILTLTFKEIEPEEGKSAEIWNTIVQTTETIPVEYQSVETEEENVFVWTLYRRFRIAAVVIVLLAAGLVGFMYRDILLNIHINTAYGESKAIVLPDGTKVTLQPNSELQYPRWQFHTGQREIWMNGDAYFAVVHKANHQNFLVHTPELKVEVLGTRFTVHTRRGNSQVILNEGKVKLTLNTPTDTTPVVMQPNDIVQFIGASKKITHKRTQTESYMSWKENRWVFVATPLQNISELIEDTYGYQVIFKKEELKQLQFTGSASVQNLDELKQKLSKLFGVTIQVNQKQLIIDRD